MTRVRSHHSTGLNVPRGCPWRGFVSPGLGLGAKRPGRHKPPAPCPGGFRVLRCCVWALGSRVSVPAWYRGCARQASHSPHFARFDPLKGGLFGREHERGAPTTPTEPGQQIRARNARHAAGTWRNLGRQSALLHAATPPFRPAGRSLPTGLAAQMCRRGAPAAREHRGTAAPAAQSRRRSFKEHRGTAPKICCPDRGPSVGVVGAPLSCNRPDWAPRRG